MEAFELPVPSAPRSALAQGGATAAILAVALLIADAVLQVPSSVVMVAAGALYGPVLGTLLSLTGRVGMTLAYLAGAAAGRSWPGCSRRTGERGPTGSSAAGGQRRSWSAGRCRCSPRPSSSWPAPRRCHTKVFEEGALARRRSGRGHQRPGHAARSRAGSNDIVQVMLIIKYSDAEYAATPWSW